MNKLLPCPFCGAKPILIKDEDTQGTLYQIRCNNHDCWIGPRTSFYSEESTAIEAWDTRYVQKEMRTKGEYISRNELLEAIHSNVAENHNERCAQLLEAILNAPSVNAQ